MSEKYIPKNRLELIGPITTFNQTLDVPNLTGKRYPITKEIIGDLHQKCEDYVHASRDQDALDVWSELSTDLMFLGLSKDPIRLLTKLNIKRNQEKLDTLRQ